MGAVRDVVVGERCRPRVGCHLPVELEQPPAEVEPAEPFEVHGQEGHVGEHVPEAEAHEPWEEIHERYAARFGVDPTPGRQFAAALRAGQ